MQIKKQPTVIDDCGRSSGPISIFPTGMDLSRLESGHGCAKSQKLSSFGAHTHFAKVIPPALLSSPPQAPLHRSPSADLVLDHCTDRQLIFAAPFFVFFSSIPFYKPMRASIFFPSAARPPALAPSPKITRLSTLAVPRRISFSLPPTSSHAAPSFLMPPRRPPSPAARPSTQFPPPPVHGPDHLLITSPPSRRPPPARPGHNHARSSASSLIENTARTRKHAKSKGAPLPRPPFIDLPRPTLSRTNGPIDNSFLPPLSLFFSLPFPSTRPCAPPSCFTAPHVHPRSSPPRKSSPAQPSMVRDASPFLSPQLPHTLRRPF